MTREGVAPRHPVARVAAYLAKRPWLVYLGLTPLAHPILEIILFGERALQTAHDVFDDDVPRLFSIPADWRAFGPSLWDTHLTGGNALLAQFALPPLAPDVLLSFVVPPYLAYTLNAALMAFLAGLCMHVFLRGSLRLPTIACFAGGVLAVFGFWHYILGYAALMAPLALLWSERAAAADARRGDAVRLALLVAFLAISSQVQVVAILAAVALVWTLVTVPSAREAAGGIARWFRGWIAGALLAAPVLLTLFVAVAESQRTIWVIDPLADPIGQWLTDAGAIVFGVPVGALDRLNPLYGTIFPGVAGVALLAVSLAIPRPDRRSRAALGLLVGVLLADLVGILVLPLQADSSLLRSFQFVRVLHLAPVAVAMNVALALAWLVRGAPGGEGIGDGAGAGVSKARPAVAVAGLLAAGVAFLPQASTIWRSLNRRLDDGLDLARLEPATAGWLLAL
ncbi:MAG TPA: hypothetical protein VFP56_03650, partial [Candidatus Limnocylindrales bacterium]|nr:hypothetical protein [Candidatus Limnocylindrales bacterium]